MDDRRDDWKHSVDEHLVTLTTAQKVTDRQLEDIEKLLTRLDRVITGDPQSDLEGLVEQIHNLNREVSKLSAVIFVDSTGKKGLLKTVEDLAGGKSDRRFLWENLTKILVAIIGTGALIQIWPTIKEILVKPTPIVTVKDNHPIVRYRRVTVHQDSSNTKETNQSQE